MIRTTKGISDPVHGTIGLSEIEARVISTRAFQRLRNVKQLGLAHMVFPGADYSRFSHSLGVCHVTSRIMAALRRADVEIKPEEEQLYRLAGLLHDIGHYPFSHAMEHAIEDHYASLLTQNSSESTNEATEPDLEKLYLGHESAGKEVLQHDPELNKTLLESGFEPGQIFQIFARENPEERFANLISSDLDADRIDFLMRTAHHTGLPYGAVDLDYLLSQMRLDDSHNICIRSKALRTADHFLLGRYFDYQAVAFHKTVVCLEWLLKEVITALLKEGQIKCAPDDIRERIRSGTWSTFDDLRLFEEIRHFVGRTENQSAKVMAEAILYRQPPKLLTYVEHLGDREPSTVNGFKTRKKWLEQHIEEWSKTFKIDIDLWHIWEGGLTFTKVGSNVPISALAKDTAYGKFDEDQTNQAIRVLDDRTGISVPIMNDERSLMSVLADQALYSLRLYVVIPQGGEMELEAIRAAVRNDLDSPEWR